MFSSMLPCIAYPFLVFDTSIFSSVLYQVPPRNLLRRMRPRTGFRGWYTSVGFQCLGVGCECGSGALTLRVSRPFVEWSLHCRSFLWEIRMAILVSCIRLCSTYC